MKRIWCFWNDHQPRFAEAWERGTYVDELGLCPECRRSRFRRIQPLVIEWQPGSATIADFTWPDIGCIVVRDEVGLALAEQFRGFELGPVEMIQDPKLERTERNANRRVWLPYSGPPLHELWVTKHVHLDPERSTSKKIHECSICGSRRWETVGSGDFGSKWNKDELRLDRWEVARKPGEGVLVAESVLDGAEIFRVEEFIGWVFCTDRVKRFVEAQGYTNVIFREMGETF